MLWPKRMKKLSAEPQRLVLEDPAVRELHLALLNGAPPVGDPLRLWSARERLRRRGPSGLSKEDWSLLLSDSDGLKTSPGTGDPSQPR